jgi:lipoyl(octanoyl) transferase
VSAACAGSAEGAAREVHAASLTPAVPPLLIRHLGRVEYEPTWRAMQHFTDTRDRQSADEIWFLEHAPIFTLGMNASRAHLIAPGAIPVLQIDRGGDVTYHGPGQLVVYPLIDLKRAGLGVRALVSALEQSVVSYAADLGIEAYSRRHAPGVYVAERKLASLGIRVRRGASYHGLALNVDMDLEPFGRIDPCGYVGLQMTQLADLGAPSSVAAVASQFAPHLLRALFAHGKITRAGI